MEQVKPQHSLSRERPVLVRGEEVCWALRRGRLAGTPEKHKDVFFISSSKENSAASLMVNKLMLAMKVTTANVNVQCYSVPVLKFLGILDCRKSAISLSSSFSLQEKKIAKGRQLKIHTINQQDGKHFHWLWMESQLNTPQMEASL